MDQEYFLAHVWVCTAYGSQGMWPEARRYAESAFAMVGHSPLIIGVLAGVSVQTGDRRRAEELLAPFKDGAAAGAAIGLALFHLMCLEINEAVAWLEKAIERRERMAMLPVVFRRFCSSNPRWPAVAKMINLPG
jgi:Flp pilus assembly protein TadD